MKKIALLFLLFFLTKVYAQEFRAGFNVGIPVQDVGDAYNVCFGADLGYRWSVSDFLDLGFATGYNHFLTTNSFVNDAGFVPLALAGRINMLDMFFFGADVGYALGFIPLDRAGGFYFRPSIEYYLQGPRLTFSYRAINTELVRFRTATVGLTFPIN